MHEIAPIEYLNDVSLSRCFANLKITMFYFIQENSLCKIVTLLKRLLPFYMNYSYYFGSNHDIVI